MASIPTVTLYREGQRAVVNASDAESWRKQGWSDKAPADAPPPKPPAQARQRRGTSETGDEPTPPPAGS